MDIVILNADTGLPQTGIAFGSIKAYYCRQGGSPTAITLAELTSATAAFSAGGWFELSAANMRGWYRIHLPDAMFTTGADYVDLHVDAVNPNTLKIFPYQERLALESAGSSEIYARTDVPTSTRATPDDVTEAINDAPFLAVVNG